MEINSFVDTANASKAISGDLASMQNLAGAQFEEAAELANPTNLDSMVAYAHTKLAYVGELQQNGYSSATIQSLLTNLGRQEDSSGITAFIMSNTADSSGASSGASASADQTLFDEMRALMDPQPES
jgi:hypothetical protein